jgi:hypothetical protein
MEMPCPSLSSVYTTVFVSPKQYAVSVVAHINHEQYVHLLYRRSMIEFSTDRRGLEFRNWDHVMAIISLTRE